jgi:hypothetical protein
MLVQISEWHFGIFTSEQSVLQAPTHTPEVALASTAGKSAYDFCGGFSRIA